MTVCAGYMALCRVQEQAAGTQMISGVAIERTARMTCITCVKGAYGERRSKADAADGVYVGMRWIQGTVEIPRVGWW